MCSDITYEQTNKIAMLSDKPAMQFDKSCMRFDKTAMHFDKSCICFDKCVMLFYILRIQTYIFGDHNGITTSLCNKTGGHSSSFSDCLGIILIRFCKIDDRFDIIRHVHE